jgi:hypothetical protein
VKEEIPSEILRWIQGMLAHECDSESVLKLTILHNLKKMQRLVKIYYRIRHTAAIII